MTLNTLSNIIPTMQFTKLFNSILDSTIWQEPPSTKLVWITMLAMVDRRGEVHTSIPGLAKRAGVTNEECEIALKCFKSPDPYSRTKDHEGRRVCEIDGGFELLNHSKYRALLSAEERREYNRRKQQEYREKHKSNERINVNDMSITVNHNVSNAHITDAEAETDTLKTKRKCFKFDKPSVKDIEEYSAEINAGINAEAFFDFYETKGWVIGKSPMKDWKACVRTWKRSNQDRNQPTKTKKTTPDGFGV